MSKRPTLLFYGLLLAFFLSTLLTGAKQSLASTRCEDLFRRTSDLQAILELNSDEVAYLNRTVVEKTKYPFGIPENIVRAKIAKLLTLSAEQRSELLKLLEKNTLFSEEFVALNLRLALGDLKLWDKRIKETITERAGSPLHYFPVDGFWAHNVALMSGEARTSLLMILGRYYDRAKSSSDGRYSPKRDLDYLIHAAIQGGELITADVLNGRSPLEAYGHFLKVQNDRLNLTVGRGGYSSEVVLNVLKAIQRTLSSKGTPRLLIGGSFTAGRANLMTSDIDYMADGKVLSRDIESAMNVEVADSLSRLGVSSKLHVSHYPGEIGQPRDRSYHDDLASSNPVLFLITPESIEMYVYRTRLWKHGADYESIMHDPDIYPIE